MYHSMYKIILKKIIDLYTKTKIIECILMKDNDVFHFMLRKWIIMNENKNMLQNVTLDNSNTGFKPTIKQRQYAQCLFDFEKFSV